jgi:hypothetical protein
VTDETRLANQQQLEIVKDMLEKELKNCKPYIVISKTEAYRHNPQRQAELRKARLKPSMSLPNIRITTLF